MKYVVTAFDVSKNKRAVITKPLTESKAILVAEILNKNMNIAIPEYKNLLTIMIIPNDPIQIMSNLDGQDLTWEEIGEQATMLAESFVIHLN